MARNPSPLETAPPCQDPASAAIRRHTSPTSNNKPSDSKLCRPSFFRVDTDDRLTSRFELRALLSDMEELGVAFGRRAARLRAPGIDLGREAELTEQAGDRRTGRGWIRRRSGGCSGDAASCAWLWRGVPSDRPPSRGQAALREPAAV